MVKRSLTCAGQGRPAAAIAGTCGLQILYLEGYPRGQAFPAAVWTYGIACSDDRFHKRHRRVHGANWFRVGEPLYVMVSRPVDVDQVERKSNACAAAERYRADITAGSLKMVEGRVIADLLLRGLDEAGWKQAIIKENILRTKNPATAIRLARLIRQRLQTTSPDLWHMVRDGTAVVATHAMLAAAVKHGYLLGDFLDLVVRDQYRRFGKAVTKKMWRDYLGGCRERDPQMPQWHESTISRMGSSVFQILAQTGYVKDTRTMLLQRVHIAAEVIGYLERNHEDYVLRCITVGA